MNLSKAINGFIASLLLGIFISTVAGYITESIIIFLVFLFILIAGTYWMYKADSVKRIWGRTFVGLSISSFALPIAIFIFAAKYTANQTTGAEQVGAAIGTGIAVFVFGFLGAFAGIIFAIAAYFTYRSLPMSVSIDKVSSTKPTTKKNNKEVSKK